MEKDSRGNVYFEVDNIRITYVESCNRNPDKDWPGTDVIRIQAYRDGESSLLHRGAEIPIDTSEKINELISALQEIYLLVKSEE
jgi:hypothetical protein